MSDASQQPQSQVPVQQTPPTPPAPPAPSSAGKSDNDKVMAVLSYLSILFLIPLLATKDRSPFLAFHLHQGIVMFAAGIVVSMVGSMVSWDISNLLNLVLFVLTVVAIVKAIQHETWEIPLLGQLAKKISL